MICGYTRSTLLMVAAMAGGLVAATPLDAQGLADLKAKQVYLVESKSGTVLLAQNENQAFPPASLAKLMTMDLVFEALKQGELQPDKTFPVSENAWRTGGAPSGTTTMFAALRSQIPVMDLVREAGAQGVEFLNWITMRGALLGQVSKIHSNYHIPISNTAGATLVLENRTEAQSQAA